MPSRGDERTRRPRARGAPDADTSGVTISRRRRLLRLSAIWLAWTAFGLLVVGQTAMLASMRGESRSTWSVLATSFLTAWTWALFTPPIVVVARRLRAVR